MTLRRALLGLCVVLALPALAEQSGRHRPDEPDEAELQRLIKQMEEREAVLRELTSQEKSITRALGELDEAIARMDAEAARLDEAAQTAQQRLQAAETEAARLTRELEEAENRLRRRLEAVMRLG